MNSSDKTKGEGNMTDTLKLKLNGNVVEIGYDDNGRYSLNDLHKAASSPEDKKPSAFLRYRGKDVERVQVGGGISPHFPKDFNSYVVVTGKGRGAATYAPLPIVYRYAGYIAKEWGAKISYGIATGDIIELPPYDEVKNEASPQGVYLMKNEFGLYKIGVTCNIDRRKTRLECSSGVALEVVNYWEPSLFSDEIATALCAEGMLHDHFASFRKKGEWFDFNNEPNEKIVAAINDFMKMYVFPMAA